MGLWSFKEQRRLVEIAASSKSFQEVVDRTGRTARGIRKMARQLGIPLVGPKAARTPRAASGLKAKGK